MTSSPIKPPPKTLLIVTTILWVPVGLLGVLGSFVSLFMFDQPGSGNNLRQFVVHVCNRRCLILTAVLLFAVICSVFVLLGRGGDRDLAMVTVKCVKGEITLTSDYSYPGSRNRLHKSFRENLNIDNTPAFAICTDAGYAVVVVKNNDSWLIPMWQEILPRTRPVTVLNAKH